MIYNGIYNNNESHTTGMMKYELHSKNLPKVHLFLF